jgi:hypothetical protein
VSRCTAVPLVLAHALVFRRCFDGKSAFPPRVSPLRRDCRTLFFCARPATHLTQLLGVLVHPLRVLALPLRAHCIVPLLGALERSVAQLRLALALPRLFADLLGDGFARTLPLVMVLAPQLFEYVAFLAVVTECRGTRERSRSAKPLNKICLLVDCDLLGTLELRHRRALRTDSRDDAMLLRHCIVNKSVDHRFTGAQALRANRKAGGATPVHAERRRRRAAAATTVRRRQRSLGPTCWRRRRIAMDSRTIGLAPLAAPPFAATKFSLLSMVTLQRCVQHLNSRDCTSNCSSARVLRFSNLALARHCTSVVEATIPIHTK